MRVREHLQDEPAFMANYADTLTDAPLPEMIERFHASNAVASMIVVPPVSSHHVVEMDDSGRVTESAGPGTDAVGERGYHRPGDL